MPNLIKQKFIERMELHRLSKETQKGYNSGVRCLAKLLQDVPGTSELLTARINNRHLAEYFTKVSKSFFIN